MSDYLVKALAFDGTVRVYAANTTEMVKEAQQIHDSWATASAAFGRTLTATMMMGATLKGDDKITAKIEADGPMGAIVVDATAHGAVRGYVKNPHVHFDLNEKGKLDVARAVGQNGMLSIVKDLGMRDNFTGQVPLMSGEIGDDFTYYYAKSEQIPSSVGVGVLVNPDHTILAAGGFMVQILPDASEETIAYLEQQLQSIIPVSKMIERDFTPEQIVETLVGSDAFNIIDRMSVAYECGCSKDKFARAIMGLGKDEIQSMIEEEGDIETTCHFCNRTYDFSKDELENMYKQIR